MPHVIVKLYPGRTDEQKKEMAARIVKDIAAVAKCDEKVVSVAFEEVAKDDWAEKVYKPDIMGKKETLVIEPGYDINAIYH
jgi:4-oxalocrotonate tautomerase